METEPTGATPCTGAEKVPIVMVVTAVGLVATDPAPSATLLATKPPTEAPAPMARLLSEPAEAWRPIAIARSPLALAPTPTAIEALPLAVGVVPPLPPMATALFPVAVPPPAAYCAMADPARPMPALAITSAAAKATFDLLFLPRAEVNSEVATQAPSASFHTLRYDLFMAKTL